MAIVMPDIGNGLIMIFHVLVIIKMMRGMALMIMIMMLIIMPLRMTMITTTRMILFAGRPNRESAVDAGGEGGGSLEAEAAAAAREALPMAASPPAPRAGQVIRRADQPGRRRAAGHGKIPLAEHLTTFLFRFGLLMSGNLFQE